MKIRLRQFHVGFVVFNPNRTFVVCVNESLDDQGMGFACSESGQVDERHHFFLYFLAIKYWVPFGYK